MYVMLCHLYRQHKKNKNQMYGNLSDFQRILNNEKKPDSFAAHYEQHFKSAKSHNELGTFMAFKVVKYINHIGSMK